MGVSHSCQRKGVSKGGGGGVGIIGERVDFGCVAYSCLR